MKLNEEDDNSLIARTNNVCEFYNYILNKKIKIVKPRLSILITHLLNEEFSIREFVTKSAVNTVKEALIPNGFTVLEDQLPIGALSKLLVEKKKPSNYNLRSIANEKEFLLECRKLVERCYEVMFLTSHVESSIELNALEVKEEQKHADEEKNNEEEDLLLDLNEDYTLLFFSSLEKEKEEFENVTVEMNSQSKSVSKNKRYNVYFSFCEIFRKLSVYLNGKEDTLHQDLKKSKQINNTK